MELALLLFILAIICGLLAPYPASVILAVAFGLAALWLLLGKPR